MKIYRGGESLLFMLGAMVLLLGSLNPAKAIEVNGNGEVTEQIGNGSINWTTKRIEARGLAKPDQSVYGQVKAAQLAARAELVAVLKGIRIKGNYGVIDGLLRKDITESEIQGFLRHSYVTEPRTNELGLIEATAFVYLDPEGNSILMPKVVVFRSDKNTWRPEKEVAASSTIYTGLIIDGRGLDLEPAMAPRILAGDDRLEIYGSGTADSSIALSHGFVGYAGSMEKARAMTDRIGKNPMETKASGVARGSDLILSEEDALRIAQAVKSFNFLKECRVVIVVN